MKFAPGCPSRTAPRTRRKLGRMERASEADCSTNVERKNEDMAQK